MAEVRIASAAHKDIENITDYYETVHSGLSHQFLTCFEAAIESIERHPLLANDIEDGLTWVRIHRFPHKLVFRYNQDSDTALILGVFHHRQNPSKWKIR